MFQFRASMPNSPTIIGLPYRFIIPAPVRSTGWNVFPIAIPPLREHAEDIPPLVWAYVNEFQQKMGKEIETISKRTMEALQVHSWPGNVRELKNVVEHAMILTKGKSPL